MKKRIVIINNVPKIWGLGKYSHKLYEELKKKNNNVDHVYINFPERRVEIGDRRVRLEKLPLIGNKISYIYRATKYLPAADVYHLTSQNLSYLTNKIKNKNKKAKIVITCHDVYHHKEKSNIWKRLLSKLLYSGLKKADAIISSSAATTNDLVKHLGITKEKITTINLASDKIKKVNKKLARKKLGLPINAKIVMHVGELHGGWKNTHRIIKAVERLDAKQKEKIVLVRVGKDKYESKNVINLYEISDEEMSLLYNASDVLASALTYDITNMPIIEALKCGLPIIASRTSSLQELAGTAPYYVDPFSVKSIRLGIDKVLNDKKLRKQMIAKGLERGGKLTWENVASEVTKIYKKI